MGGGRNVKNQNIEKNIKRSECQKPLVKNMIENHFVESLNKLNQTFDKVILPMDFGMTTLLKIKFQLG